MTQRDIYAFDCGTTNWRLYRLHCEEFLAPDDSPVLRRSCDPQCVALSTFGGRQLPAALLLDESGSVRSYGKRAYEEAREPQARPYLRDAFKMCIANRLPRDPRDPRRRYTRPEALDYVRLLLGQVVEGLAREKPGSLATENRFYFAHPVHWGRERPNGALEGAILPDFAATVRCCFPEPLRRHVHFVPEPEGALLSLLQTGQGLIDDGRWKLIIDAGGGTTDFVAGRLAPTGLEDIHYYGEPEGARLFDQDMAVYLAGLLAAPEAQREAIWPELLSYGRQLKESVSQQMRMDASQPVAMSVIVQLTGPDGKPLFLSHSVRLRREEFEARTRATGAAFERSLLQALAQMKLRQEDIGQVVLVGGGSNLFLVPQLAARVFGPGVPVIYGDPPDEAVVRGVALWAARPPAGRDAPAAAQAGRPADRPLQPVPLQRPVPSAPSEQKPEKPSAPQPDLAGWGAPGAKTPPAPTGLAGGPALFIPVSGPAGLTVRVDGGGEHPSLEAAIVAAPSGGTLRLGTGEYRLGGPLYLRKSLALAGAGMDATIIIGPGEGGVLRFSGPGRLAVSDLTLRCEGVQRGTVFGVDGGAVILAGCRFAGGACGLRFGGNAGGEVRGCLFEQAQEAAIVVAGWARPVLAENTFCDNGAGIAYQENGGGAARANQLQRNKAGITVSDTAGPALEQNICRENGVGIVYTGQAGGSARANECTGNRGAGVRVGDYAAPSLAQNRCQGNQGDGILVTQRAAPVLEDNVCCENQGCGIVYRGSAAGAARRNTCTGNLLDGLLLEDLAAPAVEGSTCRENGRDGIHIAPAARPRLNDNRAEGNKGMEVSDGRG